MFFAILSRYYLSALCPIIFICAQIDARTYEEAKFGVSGARALGATRPTDTHTHTQRDPRFVLFI